MKILETNWYTHEKIWNMMLVKYELDWKVNSTPMYTIRNNELVMVYDLLESQIGAI